jgi:hypothetical protein
LYPGVQLYYLAKLIPDPTREYLYEGITDMDLTNYKVIPDRPPKPAKGKRKWYKTVTWLHGYNNLTATWLHGYNSLAATWSHNGYALDDERIRTGF